MRSLLYARSVFSGAAVRPAACRIPALQLRTTASLFARAASTKQSPNFKPPTNDELVELRERVQEFTRVYKLLLSLTLAAADMSI